MAKKARGEPFGISDGRLQISNKKQKTGNRRKDRWVWGKDRVLTLLADLMVLGVADFPSCGDVSSFYSGLRIRLRVHAPQGSCPSMTNPYRQPAPPSSRDVCWSWGSGAFVGISEDRIQQFKREAIGEETFGQIRREIRSRTRLSPLLRVNLQHDMNLLRGPTKDVDRRLGARTASSGGRDSV